VGSLAAFSRAASRLRATLRSVNSVEVQGRVMTYERRGVGAPVVFVHGYVGDGPATWRPQLDGLADEFDVIACDLPGAGGSDDPPESFGMRGFADAVAGFVTELDLQRPHMVGLSFGGATLIEFCRRHQDLASTITLVGAYAGWAGSLAAPEVRRRLDQAVELSRLDPDVLVGQLLPTMFSASAAPDVVAEFGNSLALFHPVGLRAMARACTEDLTEVLGTIRLPTLLVYGTHDTRAPAGVAHALHEAIAGSRLVQLEGAGHVCNVDAAERFDAVLRQFLGEHRRE
jgi:pimeloyl-ACP methyl ester carboxylesterase